MDVDVDVEVGREDVGINRRFWMVHHYMQRGSKGEGRYVPQRAPTGIYFRLLYFLPVAVVLRRSYWHLYSDICACSSPTFKVPRKLFWRRCGTVHANDYSI